MDAGHHRLEHCHNGGGMSAGGRMDIRHVFRLSKDGRDLAEKMAESDVRGDMELAESLRATLERALESLKLLYEDDDVWQAAAEAVAVVDVPTRQLVDLVPNYRSSLPALLELFGYLAPPPAGQLVNDAVESLQAVPADEGPVERINAVNETRQALGQLLERTLDLENAQPWQLPIIASETMPALNAGITVAAGALTGGVAAAIGGRGHTRRHSRWRPCRSSPADNGRHLMVAAQAENARTRRAAA
jgi:hypothetical protein